MRMNDFPRDRPLGISLLIWIFWFWAGAIVLLVLALAFGNGPVLVDGRPVSRDETLTSLLPALVPMALAVVGAALALALARPWARAAALFPFALAAFGPLLTGVGDVSALGLGATALVLLLILGLLVRYLYFRDGPRSYFHPSRYEDAEGTADDSRAVDRVDYDPDYDPTRPVLCEVCGAEMYYTAACKVKCPRCGYTRDCSDP